MSWSLLRIDDRLIHGQVLIAWGGRLHPRRLWLVDDAIAASEWERQLYVDAAPDFEVHVVDVAQAAAAFARESEAAGGAFLLVRDLATAWRLVEAGAAITGFNVGGLHYAPGKAKLNEFVYLDDVDREAARKLLAAGVALDAQDVPASRPQALAALEPSLAR